MQGYLMGYFCCHCAKHVLFWNDSPAGIQDIYYVYRNMGITVSQGGGLASGPVSNVDLFPLIFVYMGQYFDAIGNMAWWSDIVNKRWSGRIVFYGEFLDWTSFTSPYIDAANTRLAQVCSLRFGKTKINNPCGSAGTIVGSSPLTEGCSNVYYAVCDSVSGGTTLVNSMGGTPIIAQETVGNIDFVICGDSNIWGSCSYQDDSHNKRFYENLWNVPVNP